jgi:hypothetical protein
VTVTDIDAEVRHLQAAVQADSRLASELLNRQLRAIGGPDESAAAKAVTGAIAAAGGGAVTVCYVAAVLATIRQLVDRVAGCEAQLRALGHTPPDVPSLRTTLTVTSAHLGRLADRGATSRRVDIYDPDRPGRH